MDEDWDNDGAAAPAPQKASARGNSLNDWGNPKPSSGTKMVDDGDWDASPARPPAPSMTGCKGWDDADDWSKPKSNNAISSSNNTKCGWAGNNSNNRQGSGGGGANDDDWGSSSRGGGNNNDWGKSSSSWGGNGGQNRGGGANRDPRQNGYDGSRSGGYNDSSSNSRGSSYGRGDGNGDGPNSRGRNNDNWSGENNNRQRNNDNWSGNDNNRGGNQRGNNDDWNSNSRGGNNNRNQNDDKWGNNQRAGNNRSNNDDNYNNSRGSGGYNNRQREEDDWGGSSNYGCRNNDDYSSNARGGSGDNSRRRNDDDNWGGNSNNNNRRGGDDDDWSNNQRGNNNNSRGGSSNNRQRNDDDWGGGGNNNNRHNNNDDDWGSSSRDNNNRQRNNGNGSNSRSNNNGGWGDDNNDNRGKSSNSWGNDESNNRSGGAKRDRDDGKQDEWKCSCGSSNFATRFKCRQCQASKPGDDGNAKKKRPGDWGCSCGFQNFASRSECKSCNAAKPEGAGNDEDGGQPQVQRYTRVEDNIDDLYKSNERSSANFEAFENMPVKVIGEDVPRPYNTFSDCGLNSFLVDIAKRCKFDKALPIQRYAMPVVMAKRDLMARADTGSGKTAAFLFPIIHQFMADGNPTTIGQPHAIIIAPTRELAIQIYEEGRKFTHNSVIRVCVVYGGESKFRQRNEFKKGCHILVATPGRLDDFMQNGEISCESLRCVVLDEGDRLLDMGFLEKIRGIIRHRTAPPADQLQTLMFSATFSSDIQQLAAEFLRDSVFIQVGIERSSTVKQTIYQVPKNEKRKKMMELLNESDPVGTIVFVETKRNADFLASYLSDTTHTSTSIHGDRTQQQREEALREFRQGKRKVLIATSVAARGLDLPEVNHVINYELPKEFDEYIHRIGRTGRVGRAGRATSFFDPEQNSNLVHELAECLRKANQEVPDFLGGSGGSGNAGNDNGGDEDNWD